MENLFHPWHDKNCSSAGNSFSSSCLAAKAMNKMSTKQLATYLFRKSSAMSDPNKEFFKKKKKIIIPVNLFGPNNQMMGLREGLFLSRLMNRNFVPPLFFPHYSISGSFSSEAALFIDQNNLSRMDKRSYFMRKKKK